MTRDPSTAEGVAGREMDAAVGIAIGAVEWRDKWQGERGIFLVSTSGHGLEGWRLDTGDLVMHAWAKMPPYSTDTAAAIAALEATGEQWVVSKQVRDGKSLYKVICGGWTGYRGLTPDMPLVASAAILAWSASKPPTLP